MMRPAIPNWSASLTITPTPAPPFTPPDTRRRPLLWPTVTAMRRAHRSITLVTVGIWSARTAGRFPSRCFRALGYRRRACAPGDLDRNEDAVRLAWSAQVSIQQVCALLAQRARQVTGLDAVCLSGGVALNCSSNGLLPQPIYVPPPTRRGCRAGRRLDDLSARAPRHATRSVSRSPYPGCGDRPRSVPIRSGCPATRRRRGRRPPARGPDRRDGHRPGGDRPASTVPSLDHRCRA